jgi:hypothetical protein
MTDCGCLKEKEKKAIRIYYTFGYPLFKWLIYLSIKKGIKLDHLIQGDPLIQTRIKTQMEPHWWCNG